MIITRGRHASFSSVVALVRVTTSHVDLYNKDSNQPFFLQIRQLQRVDRTGEWRAYVLELEEIGEVSR